MRVAAMHFGDLPIGARLRCDGQVYTKMEHELREGMLQCSNAVSDFGQWTLLAPEEVVDVIAMPGA